nr:MAG TPA: hypothetical protein [Caudoviricetes sp.]
MSNKFFYSFLFNTVTILIHELLLTIVVSRLHIRP